MKLQRALICVVGVFIAVGFVTTQTNAGGDPPGCTDADGNLMQIEINALRTSGRAITSGSSKETSVTSKARILKGTAVSGTVIDTTLTIEAIDGTTVISSSSTGPIRFWKLSTTARGLPPNHRWYRSPPRPSICSTGTIPPSVPMR